MMSGEFAHQGKGLDTWAHRGSCIAISVYISMVQTLSFCVFDVRLAKKITYLVWLWKFTRGMEIITRRTEVSILLPSSVLGMDIAV